MRAMYPILSPVSFIAVAIGAAIGAWLRWLFGLFWNGPAGLPWGTLAANLLGGYVIGVMVALVAAHPAWPAWVRLAAITGFLGGLTTFSTFSAETVAMIEHGDYASALGYAAVSVCGSLLLTGAGLMTVRAMQ
jgi:CrcB protein